MKLCRIGSVGEEKLAIIDSVKKLPRLVINN